MAAGLLEITPRVIIPESELSFRTSRSSGPGGQNVNKLSTKVELLFDLRASRSIPDDARQRIAEALRSRLDRDGVLHIVSQASRSQWENKQHTIERFVELLQAALRPTKNRLKTKATRSSQMKRLNSKKIHSSKKKNRGGRLGTGDE